MSSSTKKIAWAAFSDAMALAGSIGGVIVGLIFALAGRYGVIVFHGWLFAAACATHILNPLTGRSPTSWRAVTVHHPSAAVADALSTALFAASPEQLKKIGNNQESSRIWAVRTDGTSFEYGG